LRASGKSRHEHLYIAGRNRCGPGVSLWHRRYEIGPYFKTTILDLVGYSYLFQLLTNGYLTSQKIVTYNPEASTGTRIAYAPIEDLFFGFALVTLTMLIWEWVGPSSKKAK